MSFSYLTGYFGGVSDMYHGRGVLQPREVLAPHGLLIVLFIVFLSAADTGQTGHRQELREHHAAVPHNATVRTFLTNADTCSISVCVAAGGECSR